MTKDEGRGVGQTLDDRNWVLLTAAWIIALGSTLGALFIGEVMGQTPCVLCWHQRVFMFPLVIILGVACFRADSKVWVYALPLGVGGLAIAAYHVLLYAGIIPDNLVPCGKGPSCASSDTTILGSVPIPLLSFGAFVAVTVLLTIVGRRSAT